MSQVLLQTQIEDLFQGWTSGWLNTTDPSAVRIGWPTDGAPAWKITDDVCFLLVRYADDPYTRQIMTEYSPADAWDAYVNATYTLVVEVTWNLYGPNSFDYADVIRASLFQDATTAALAQHHLALITEVAMPQRVPELFDGQWWNRCVLSAKFNQLVVRQSTVPYLQTANIQVLEG